MNKPTLKSELNKYTEFGYAIGEWGMQTRGFMKASEKAKAAGLKSLAELAKRSGESPQTLNNWFNNRPLRFDLILKGVVVEKLCKS